MKMKLIVALVSESITDSVIDAAREGGATGETVITSGRGEGLKPTKTFLGLNLAASRNVVLFLVAESEARNILERIREAGNFDSKSGTGIAFAITIDDVVGLESQLPSLLDTVLD